MHNLLTEPLIRTGMRGGKAILSLPGIYEAALVDRVESFPGLRPHQRHAWHVTLAQLGALAVHRAGLADIPRDEGSWTGILRSLTEEFPGDEPWQMVTEDITLPAFMQPPVTTRMLEAQYGREIRSLVDLDVLVTSKNHFIKQGEGHSDEATLDEWLFALVSSTMIAGYEGGGVYGNHRMNGGRASRMGCMTTPSLRFGAHLGRDIRMLLDRRSELLDGGLADGGIGIGWAYPWDGQKEEAWTIGHIDPFYVDVTRRVRLQRVDGHKLYALRATSKASRVEARSLKGVVGDPWTPVNTKRGVGLTMSEAAFRPDRIVSYLTDSDQWMWPIAMRPTREEIESSDPLHMLFRALDRGSGETNGYHEVAVEIRPEWKRPLFGSPDGLEFMGRIAKERQDTVRVLTRSLWTGALAYICNGDSSGAGPSQRDRASRVSNRLERVLNEQLVENSIAEVAAGAAGASVRRQWEAMLVDRARTSMGEAISTLTCVSSRRYEARAKAEGVFEGRLRREKSLAHVFENDEPFRERFGREIEQDVDEAGRLAEAVATVLVRREPVTRREMSALANMDPQDPPVDLVDSMMAAAVRMTRPRVANAGAGGRLSGDDLVRWAMVLHVMAQMMRRRANPHGTVHSGRTSNGWTIFEGNGDGQGGLRPAAFNAWLTSRGRQCLAKTSEMLLRYARSRLPLNWRQMGQLIMDIGVNEERAERIRYAIARDYFAAESRADD